MSMKKKVIVFSVLFLILSAARGCFAAERILDYSQLVSVQKNSDIFVKESIKINVEHNSITHGIVRSFPTVREDSDGRRRQIGFEMQNALLDGTPVPFSTDYSSQECNIRIGSADIVIPRGMHTFTLFYTAKGEIGFFDDHDELYWNVTGNEWNFPIDRASCAVQLPEKSLGEDFTAVEWYVGSYGEKGDKSAAELTGDGTVRTTRPLRKGEGLTVAFGWRKGVVTQPQLPRLDDPKTHTAVGIFVFTAIFVWLLYAWRCFGRDPVKTVIPLFHAPEGFSPAALKYAENLAFDDKTLLSANIVNLAVKGALTIEQTGGERKFLLKAPVSYVLHKTDKMPKNLTSDEVVLLGKLFEADDVLDLSKEQHETLYAAEIQVKAACRAVMGKLYGYNSAPFSVAALVYAAGVALLYFRSDEVFPFDMFACGFGGVIMYAVAMQKERRLGRFGIGMFVRRVVLQLIFAFIGTSLLTSLGNNPLPYLIFCASMTVISIFRPLMAARTERGAELYAQAEGLKMYMTAAEKERLEMLNPPEETPQLFEDLLPYALALGVAKTWADRFSKVLEGVQYKPQWCTGGTVWFPMDFTGTFGNRVRSAAAPVAENSVGSDVFGGNWSSGLGGGGFSGGGGGGGGGSGW